MTTEMKDANERVALLLGWRRYEFNDDTKPGEGTHHWLARGDEDGADFEIARTPPDYTQWDRFGELAAFADKLDDDERERLQDLLGRNWSWTITPTALRNAIDSVCGEEA